MRNRKLTVDLIGYDCGWGCGDYGCEDGPLKIDVAALQDTLASYGMAPRWAGPLGIKALGDHDTLNTKEKTLPLVQEALKRLSSNVRVSAERNHIPVVLGGDHSSAIGTWSGVVAGHANAGRFGLIWMDAHLDAHTYETSYQGKWGGWWHGQPIAALTGKGLPAFTSIFSTMKKISPEHISIIGPHSFEPAEMEYVKSQNIRVYHLEEVEQRGFQNVFAESLARATSGTDGFGLSIDLDGFQASDAPGVSTAEGPGMKAADVLPILASLAHHPRFQALEIVEFNPAHDIEHKTARLVHDLAASIFKPRA